MPRSNSGSGAGSRSAKPGAMLKKLRIQRGWTLMEVSRRTGYPVSTLSKIENDRVSLTYDKLTRISEGLEVDFSQLFGVQEPERENGSGRRSIARAGEGRLIESRNYIHVYPAAELLNKRLIPIVVEVRARSLEEFGPLVRHTGEEYIFVLEGEIEVHTSLYAPVHLAAGDSIYLDSAMGHAYIAASDASCRILAICSGSESQMMQAVSAQAAQSVASSPGSSAGRSGTVRRRARARKSA